jgi:hypothetical protein
MVIHPSEKGAEVSSTGDGSAFALSHKPADRKAAR